MHIMREEKGDLTNQESPFLHKLYEPEAEDK